MATGTTRSTKPQPQTLKQAKAEYKKHGPRLSSQEDRQLSRSNELWRRADKIRQNEKRRKEALKRRQEKEQREREVRRRMGIASQKPCVSPHQGLIVNFVAVSKSESDEKVEGLQDDGWDEGLDDDSLLELDTPDNIQTRIIERSETRVTEGGPSQDTYSAKTGSEMAIETMDDIWDGFLESGTQIQREINHDVQPKPASITLNELESGFDIISTQDVTISEADWKEIGIPMGPSQTQVEQHQLHPQHALDKAERDRMLMPPPKIPPRFTCTHQPRPKVEAYSGCAEENDIYDFLLTDFDLSSQDFREIAG